MPMSFQEKSLWLVMTALLLVYGNYFMRVLPPGGDSVADGDIGLLVGSVVILVVLLIIGHSILAIMHTPEKLDERDRLIARKAARLKSFLISSGAVASIMAALFLAGNFWSIHILLLALVAGELFDLGVQLHGYRRGH